MLNNTPEAVVKYRAALERCGKASSYVSALTDEEVVAETEQMIAGSLAAARTLLRTMKTAFRQLTPAIQAATAHLKSYADANAKQPPK